jgi:hypothetical protein
VTFITPVTWVEVGGSQKRGGECPRAVCVEALLAGTACEIQRGDAGCVLARFPASYTARHGWRQPVLLSKVMRERRLG